MVPQEHRDGAAEEAAQPAGKFPQRSPEGHDEKVAGGGAVPERRNVASPGADVEKTFAFVVEIQESQATCGLYYNHVTIVNDPSSGINK